jgi:hypothetical protein
MFLFIKYGKHFFRNFIFALIKIVKCKKLFINLCVYIQLQLLLVEG